MAIAVGQFVCFPVGLSQRPLNECSDRRALEVACQFPEYCRYVGPSRHEFVESSSIPVVVRPRRHHKNLRTVVLWQVAE